MKGCQSGLGQQPRSVPDKNLLNARTHTGEIIRATDFQTILSCARAHHLARFAAVLVIMVAARTALNGGQTGSKRSASRCV